MVDLGAEGVAFDTIVASGPNGAIPHHVPGDRRLRQGDLVTIDFGAPGRLSRGHDPDGEHRGARAVAAGHLRPGGTGAAGGHCGRGAWRRADRGERGGRDLIGEAGHGEHFKHGLGHGVGLEVHEAPMLGYGSTGRLAPRVPVTIEPGVYLPGRGGVRIEDVLVVDGAGASGPGGLLTTTTRELLAL